MRPSYLRVAALLLAAAAIEAFFAYRLMRGGWSFALPALLVATAAGAFARIRPAAWAGLALLAGQLLFLAADTVIRGGGTPLLTLLGRGVLILWIASAMPRRSPTTPPSPPPSPPS